MKRGAAFALILLLAAAAAHGISGGSARGKLVVQSEEIALAFAYVLDSGSGLRIVLADAPIEEIHADVEKTYLPAGVQGVVLHLDDEFAAKEAFFIHPEIAGVSVREIPRFERKKSKKGTLAGRIVMDDPGFSFGFDATFEAPVVKIELQPLPQPPDPVTGMSDEERNGALANAVERGDVEEAAKLIAAGADVNQSDSYKQSLVMRASTRPEMIRLLAGAGADVNAPNQWKMTPLIVAAEQGSMDSVRALIDSGAKVNARNTSGLTALGIAAMRGHQEIVRYLLDSGADAKRDTADLLEYAKEFPAIQAMIREAAAKK
jgi:hypothetical protein